ncbi:unnamed protein product [Polarella glacialis]|uniref:Uncharacterized protein n=1 Tax=Polarella glacialis TaxID=89957 RepID=A0A813IHC8_POLGL|nr:unnamed protein product [Polarella glacialis]
MDTAQPSWSIAKEGKRRTCSAPLRAFGRLPASPLRPSAADAPQVCEGPGCTEGTGTLPEGSEAEPLAQPASSAEPASSRQQKAVPLLSSGPQALETATTTAAWDAKKALTALLGPRRGAKPGPCSAPGLPAVLVLTALLVAWPWIGYGTDVHEDCQADQDSPTSASTSPTDLPRHRLWHCYQKYIFLADCVGLCFLAALVTVSQLRWWLTSRYLVAVRLYVIMTWLAVYIYCLLSMFKWCYSSHIGKLVLNLQSEHELKTATRTWRQLPGALHSPYMIFCLIAVNLQWMVWGWGLHLVRRHLSKLEAAFQKSLGATALKWALYWDMFALLASALCFVLLFVCGWLAPTLAYVFYGIAISVAATVVCMLILVLWGFWLSLRFAQTELRAQTAKKKRSELDSPSGPSGPSSQTAQTEKCEQLAEQAVRVARRLVCEAPLGLLPTLLALASQIWSLHSWGFAPEAALNIVSVLSLVANCRFVILLSGIDLFDFANAGKRRKARLQPRAAAEKANHLKAKWTTGDEGWDSKVLDLAGRGITLRALLRFYRRLGTSSVMPHFDPAKHSTADVARQAIIPLSKDTRYGSSSMSTVLMRGKSVLPMKMVTHSWSNRFSHLVAAVVADALDLPEYEAVVGRLDRFEIGALEEELYWEGKLDQTFWICLFAVNQHASICARILPQECDPVTGKQPLPCTCGFGKFGSQTPPLRHDGQSILCEMNKFDDMMACIAAAEPGFAQLLAVDKDFTIFRRAWCVAEIHQAYSLRLPQKMLVFSEATLTRYKSYLKTLKVEDMEASHPADRDMILARISDKASFNEEVQRLLFDDGGLLEEWRGGFDHMTMLGEVARRGYERAKSSQSELEEQP